MEKKLNYTELFKSSMEADELQKLIARWDDEETEQDFTKAELKELMKIEGRRRMENLEEAEKTQKEIDEKFNRTK